MKDKIERCQKCSKKLRLINIPNSKEKVFYCKKCRLYYPSIYYNQATVKTICFKCRKETKLEKDKKYPSLYHCKLCGWDYYDTDLSEAGA